MYQKQFKAPSSIFPGDFFLHLQAPHGTGCSHVWLGSDLWPPNTPGYTFTCPSSSPCYETCISPMQFSHCLKCKFLASTPQVCHVCQGVSIFSEVDSVKCHFYRIGMTLACCEITLCPPYPHPILVTQPSLLFLSHGEARYVCKVKLEQLAAVSLLVHVYRQSSLVQQFANRGAFCTCIVHV